jgi:succinylglutamic semialdehyde dehydrogenase
VPELVSRDPSTGAVVWRGRAATPEECDRAMRAARAAFPAWSRLDQGARDEIARAYAARARERAGELAAAISAEVGKPPWEAAAEAELVAAKVEISIEALASRRSEFAAGPAVTRFRPHGVCVVLGPYNYPAHLPNGHAVPALLAGNCVVLKPSEHAPSVAELMAGLWAEAGLPEGVLAVVQGGRAVAGALLDHPELDGVFLTGSAATGAAVHRRFAGEPQRILALEMGGNNPLVVHEVADPVAAAYLAARSAYLTAGQRCTCARRLIVPAGAAGDRFVGELAAMTRRITVGPPTDRPEPFIGPVISPEAAGGILAAQADLLARGGRALVEARALAPGTGLLSPGLVDVTEVAERPDREIFGPLLQLVRSEDLEDAIAEAASTAYGLAAGILTDDEPAYRRFAEGVRAGVVNWNHELVGASSRAPFGGVGLSGNHRPSALFAADYCSYPVASIERPRVELPDEPFPGLVPGRP